MLSLRLDTREFFGDVQHLNNVLIFHIHIPFQAWFGRTAEGMENRAELRAFIMSSIAFCVTEKKGREIIFSSPKGILLQKQYAH